MNANDRAILAKIEQVLAAVRGVENPADVKGMRSFYEDMAKVRPPLLRVLRGLAYPHAYDGAEDHLPTLAQVMRILAAKGSLLNPQGWWTAYPEKRRE